MDNLFYERQYWDCGKNNVCGVDEVGRGPLAGPVVCCAVIMPENDLIEGVKDSKKLSESKREKLDKLIREKAVALSICEIPAEEIDEINILRAVKKCMTAAVEGLRVKPDVIMVDGPDTGLPIPVKYIIKGDNLSYTIGCASIVAKVYRDNLMKNYAKEYPVYGFEKHKGYGTKEHIERIKEFGPCSLHRRTFIKNFWEE